MTDGPNSPGGDRLAKVIARSGLCSRRDAEGWIRDGRVSVNGAVIRTPAFNVTAKDRVSVDGTPLAARQGTRVWLYHKPPGLVVTESDPEGRPTIFEALEQKGLPRVLTVGRLDLNTEGLLLLTNDGGLKRVLELPSTGWLRRYRVRAFGSITQAQLDVLKEGIELDGVTYGPIDATLEREQGSNTWLNVALREGKNREVKNVLAALGLSVNRLIRVSYGPFQLGDLQPGAVATVPSRVLRDQLGKKLAAEAGADFDSDMPDTPADAGEAAPVRRRPGTDPSRRMSGPGKEQAPRRGGSVGAVRPQRLAPVAREDRPIRHRPGRGDALPPKKARPERPLGKPRRILFDDGREEEFRPPPPRDERPSGKRGEEPAGRPGAKPAGRPGEKRARKFGDRPRSERPARKFGDKPARVFGDRPPRADRPPRGDDRPRPAAAGRPERRGAGPEGDRRRPTGGFVRVPRPDGPPRGPRPGGPARGSRPGAKPGPAPRPGAPRPSGARPAGPKGRPRPGGPPRGPRPGGGKPPRKPRP
jgi:23S rRNA pseudouridine2605 synthase